MKVRDVARVLRANGFDPDRQRGSHRQFIGFVDNRRRVATVAGNERDDIPPGTLSAIWR